MTLLELKKIKLELIRVSAARCELEFRIDEREDEIKRIRDHIKIQLDKEIELQSRIAEAEQLTQG